MEVELADTIQHGRGNHAEDNADHDSKPGEKKKYPPRSRKRGLQRKNKGKESEQSVTGGQKMSVQADGKETAQDDRKTEKTT